MVNLHCRVCDCMFATYQKDGPGALKRLYFDRIKPVGPETLDMHTGVLKCPGCKEPLAVPYVYKKENRDALLVLNRMVVKKKLQ